MVKNKIVLKALATLSMLTFPMLSTVHAETVETSIDYTLDKEDVFLIYDVSNTEYETLTKEELLAKSESIFAKLTPTETKEAKPEIAKGDYYIITNKSKTLSPIILKGGSVDRVVGKHTTPDIPSKPIPGQKPGQGQTFKQTNTASSRSYLLLGAGVSVLSLALLMSIKKQTQGEDNH